ncbi:WD40-repeat-containing domain protein [Aspergillus pseudotamarii]|uniref:WD40-repeat-containing domain protein n=1 Tax=Aspergillus pseudotamarii TaxID=132259 RepID=A0A5N6STT4_ASPPS|nr:WD40-repeat-containing domain protein [Aspergillus pseudotamarii]KAE8136544.1 WD40-repeat-containing domain protein [Aspergillus pseudotamarii]
MGMEFFSTKRRFWFALKMRTPRSVSRSSPVASPAPDLSYPPGLGVNFDDVIRNWDKLPLERKKAGDQWSAVINPDIDNNWEIDLLHSLTHDSIVNCVQFSNDGKYVAVGCADGTVQVIEVSTGVQVARLQDDEYSHDCLCVKVKFLPDNYLLLTANCDGNIRIWNYMGGLLRRISCGSETGFFTLDLPANGHLIVFSERNKTLKAWDLDAASDIRQLGTLHTADNVYTVAVSPDSCYIAAGCDDGMIYVWRVARPDPGAVSTNETSIEILLQFQAHDENVMALSFTPDSRSIISGGMDSTAKLWNIDSLKTFVNEDITFNDCTLIYKAHQDMVLSVSPDPTGKWILSGSKDMAVYLWDVGTGVAEMRLGAHGNSVLGIAWSPTGNIVATGGGDRVLRLWRLRRIGQ